MFSRILIRNVLPSSIKIGRSAWPAKIGSPSCRVFVFILTIFAFLENIINFETANYFTPTVFNKSDGIVPVALEHNVSSRRSYSERANSNDMTVDFDYVKEATSKTDTLIVDVREAEEVKEHGKIPNSVNIPLGNVMKVLRTMPAKDFELIYDRPKPSEDTEIIFYCMIGKRSGSAQQDALSVGFKNAKNYLGSFTDWKSKAQ